MRSLPSLVFVAFAILVLALAFVSLAFCAGVGGDRVLVGVATNFRGPMREIAERFMAAGGPRVELSAASTGKLYAQIVNGAPYAVLVAADAERPRRLSGAGLAAGAPVTYALGRLALWSADPHRVDDEGRALATGAFERLAIANPTLAPYGKAAREVLEARGLWASVQDRLVLGENIGQAFQFAHAGNADLAFVAASQVIASARAGAAGSSWSVPAALHAPIRQQAVALVEDDAAARFVAFLGSAEARAIIARHGYDLPPTSGASR